MYVDILLTHFVLQQKLTQHSKAIILQFKTERDTHFIDGIQKARVPLGETHFAEGVGHLRKPEALKYRVVSFYGLANFIG